ncbi:hypothetical protein DFH07DRAFT_774429 [Mycena maculata]|uniref:Uncharacterized protein n=1 Tax=Mycena maculata TaxID=230809 RepID=A0AAD7J0J2_9AGAR|nr:hypothetical protein DFH07DRAFT_774429 [Mycena maculata]
MRLKNQRTERVDVINCSTLQASGREWQLQSKFLSPQYAKWMDGRPIMLSQCCPNLAFFLFLTISGILEVCFDEGKFPICKGQQDVLPGLAWLLPAFWLEAKAKDREIYASRITSVTSAIIGSQTSRSNLAGTKCVYAKTADENVMHGQNLKIIRTHDSSSAMTPDVAVTDEPGVDEPGSAIGVPSADSEEFFSPGSASQDVHTNPPYPVPSTIEACEVMMHPIICSLFSLLGEAIFSPGTGGLDIQESGTQVGARGFKSIGGAEIPHHLMMCGIPSLQPSTTSLSQSNRPPQTGKSVDQPEQEK